MILGDLSAAALAGLTAAVLVIAAGWRFIISAKLTEKKVDSTAQLVDFLEKEQTDLKSKLEEYKKAVDTLNATIQAFSVELKQIPTREELAEHATRMMLRQDRLYELFAKKRQEAGSDDE